MNVPDGGYSMNVPDGGYSMNVPDGGYSRNGSCALHLISTFLLVHTQTQWNLLMVILFIYQTNIVRDKSKHVYV